MTKKEALELVKQLNFKEVYYFKKNWEWNNTFILWVSKDKINMIIINPILKQFSIR